MAQLKDSVIAGNLRVTDKVLADEVQTSTVNAPVESGSSSYGPGSNGDILKSNGTTSYWGAIANASSSEAGLMTANDKVKLDNINGINVYYVVGPDTDTTAGTWTGTITGLTAYYEGLTVLYVPAVAGASTTTLNINNIGAATCYYTGTTKLTTHYAVGSVIMLTYYNNGWKRCDYDSNTNTILRVYTQDTGYNGDYPVLVSRTDAATITAKDDGANTSVYGIVYKTNAPTLNPSTGLMKVKDIAVTDKVTAKYSNVLLTGTGTAGQAGSASAAYVPSLWTFNLGFTPTAGDIITLKTPVAGVNAGVWLSVNNGTTYYPVAVSEDDRFTTQYPADVVLQLVYETGLTTNIYGTDETGAAAGASTSAYTGDRWSVLNYRDTNTTYSAITLALLTAGTSTSNRTINASIFKQALQAVIAQSNGKLQIYGSNVGVGINQGSANAGKVLTVGSDGVVTPQTASSGLPAVTSSDNGKILQVVNGAWAAVSIPSANGQSF